ncbi:MAG: hypothetical protein QG551_310 [Patescibacteria group bacterium]|jgi:protein-S-isoprenylcysteine O-methyltransferase Ste14|nr:hypothetical protein [Patescibacteria group bacterium]
MEKNSVSYLSSYSISIFALGLFAGVLLDIFFPYHFMSEPLNKTIGLLTVILATTLIYWSEKHGNEYSKKRKGGEVSHVDHMRSGPYKYTRNPKYLGLALLLIGLGIILNSLFIILSSVASGLIIHFFFITKEEALLTERHGEIYKEYKGKVRKWF